MKTDKKKSRAIAGAAFVNRDQVLGGGCNCEIADIKRISQVFGRFKSADMLVSKILYLVFGRIY
jgi:hypothetical protein